MIAIVGHTGAGKTTIINLLMRFYDANSGDINFDGKEIKEVKRDSIRRAYTMVLQDTWLFRGTVYENIAYGAGDVSMEQVVEAAKVAKAIGMKVIALTGKSGGVLKNLADITITAPETETYKVQELHLPIYHYICAKIESHFFG